MSDSAGTRRRVADGRCVRFTKPTALCRFVLPPQGRADVNIVAHPKEPVSLEPWLIIGCTNIGEHRDTWGPEAAEKIPFPRSVRMRDWIRGLILVKAHAYMPKNRHTRQRSTYGKKGARSPKEKGTVVAMEICIPWM